MAFLIGVEIDNSRIVWIYDSEKDESSAVKLTTVTSNQKNAEIKFYIKYLDKKHHLCAENVTDIPLMPAGKPSIEIIPFVKGKMFHYEIYVNERLVKRSRANISDYRKTRKPLFLIPVILAIIAALILIFLFLIQPLLIIPDSFEKSVTEAEVKPAIEQPEPEIQPEPETPPEPVVPPVQPIFIESEISDRHIVYFNPDSSVLSREAIQALEIFIRKLPDENDFDEGLFKMEVRGHCAKYGTEEGRAELSRDRAVNVYNFLKSEWGIEADSVISGAGASEPVTLKRDEQYLNRRVDINIKGNLSKKQ